MTTTNASRTRAPSLAARLNELPIPEADRARYVRELAHAEAFAEDLVNLVRDVRGIVASIAGWFTRRRPGFAR
jgi:hypothetical protein